jgi:hypothetical protein
VKANQNLINAFGLMTGTSAGGDRTAMPTQPKSERALDETLQESFPASDPPANSGITGAEAPNKPSDDEKPTGTPTSDRHSTETAHHSENAKR